MESTFNTGDLATALIGGMVVLVTVLFTALQDVIKALSQRVIVKLVKVRVKPRKHEFFDKLFNYLQTVDSKEFAKNPYKQAVIVAREKLLWGTVGRELAILSDTNIDADDRFADSVRKVLVQLNDLPSMMIKEGIPEKTVKLMESAVIANKTFINNLIAKILRDDAMYDYNSEKLWAILTILTEYLDYAHQSSIELLIKANGELAGEVYKGIINDGY